MICNDFSANNKLNLNLMFKVASMVSPCYAGHFTLNVEVVWIGKCADYQRCFCGLFILYLMICGITTCNVPQAIL